MKNKICCDVVESSDSPLPSGFLEQLPAYFSREGKTIYKGRNEIKIFQINGKTLCVKKYGLPPRLNRVLYSWGWRKPKARRTYENAQMILERGFRTPRQYGYVLVRKNGQIYESFSVGEFIEQVRTVAQDKKNEKLVQAFARFTADLHAHGLMHRDYILNNVLYTCKDGEYYFTLIDVNRFIFRRKPIRGFLRRLNLMQPFPDKREMKRFVSYYQDFSNPTSPQLWRQVGQLRGWRNRYSQLKRFLKKLPGARFWTSSRSK